MDVNEEIVREWLHLCKNQFTIDNIPFKVWGPKGGSNYSNIDLLATDTNGVYYNYEIKWRSAYSLSGQNKEEIKYFIEQVLNKERLKKIKEIIGGGPLRHVFVTTYKHFGMGEEKRKRVINEFNKKDIAVLFFEDIIIDLVKRIDTVGRFDSPVLQTIRMIKYFDLLKESD